MKLWEKGVSPHQKIDQFTVGNDRELDLILAKYDVQASKAHATMLGKIGILTEEEVEKIVDCLNDMTECISNELFTIEDDFEDVHSKIEFLLTSRLGTIGKKIHTARSRNDQVLVAMQLYLKDELAEIKGQTKMLFDLLLDLAKTYQNVLMPGYTHLQIAMPSSFGLWFSAYAESLVDDLYFIDAAYKVADQNPLGSAAGYGSSFPINRVYTTEALQFKTLKYNVVAAQMSRGKVEKSVGFGISSLAATLAKFSMDVCLYASQNFDFIGFPDELTTGSSIMPHKKNPDVFELIRGKCNKLQALPNQLAMMTTNLPSGYHRDLQLVKEVIVPAIQELKSCLEMAHFSLKDIKVNERIINNPMYDHIFSVDTLNELVQNGTPFREAYHQVAKQIAEGTFVPKKDIQHTHEGSIGNLCLDDIREKMKAIL